MRRWIFQVGALGTGLVLLFIGLLALGRVTRERARGLDGYTVAFDTIDCPTPSALGRADFLSEVQYLSNMPGRFSVWDEGLAARLADAFAAHPWVERVERVEVRPRPRVRLAFRVPVLALEWVGDAELPAVDLALPIPRRVVDGHGVLLPAAASAEGLPVLRVRRPGPPAPAGKRLNLAVVESAARTAAFLHANAGQLHLEAVEADDGLVWKTANGSRILWGRPPGAEMSDEPDAACKRKWLLDYCARHGDLDHPDGPYEHDVRSKAAATHRPLRADR